MDCATDRSASGALENLGKEFGLVFRDAHSAPFDLYQCCSKAGEPFRRVPADIAEKTNEGVAGLALHTCGIRLRFRTDSRRLGLRVKMSGGIKAMRHMAVTGSSGFDIFLCENGQQRFCDFLAPDGPCTAYGGVLDFGEKRMRDVLINFPLYNEVDALEIGLESGAAAEHGGRYRDIAPVLYYGSSITQGGCASRPGNAYQSIISRRFDLDFINMGFSGSARGEDIMTDWLCSFSPSVFVCDYDHNAPDAEHLKKTHFRLYSRYRAAKPDTPVIFVTKPDFDGDPAQNAVRRAVVRATFERAGELGDKNVRFIDGETLFGGAGRDVCTVDGCHPTDLGFWRMAERIGDVIGEVLGL